MTTFGSSAPLKDLQKKFGFTPEQAVAAAKEQLTRSRRHEPSTMPGNTTT
jgi:transketolase